MLNFENPRIFGIKQLQQFWEIGQFSKLEIFRILQIRSFRNFLNWKF